MQNFSHSLVICILCLVQFIDVLDFMVVMPLGPDLASSLGIEQSNLGWLSSSYAIAAAISGIASSTIVDRFDRKRVLIFTLCGLAAANILSALSWNVESILASRFLAGAFGGPATSICFAIVTDLFPVKDRGAVMGKVMSGFSIAAILGVPISLIISNHYGWQASFYIVSSLTMITVLLLTKHLPSMVMHLSKEKRNQVTYKGLFNKLPYILSFLAAFCGSMAAFMLIPYISSFVQFNMNFPRVDIGQIYLVGGVGSFFAMRIAGKIVDKTSSFYINLISNIFILFTIMFGFILAVHYIPKFLLFAPFMIGMSIRNVSNYTLYSKVPSILDRAGFMSVISCIQHIASSFGASFSSVILITQENGVLENIVIVSIVAGLLFMISPLILHKVEKKVINHL